MSDPLVGLYPGTFDPVTNGHMDIILRSARMVDHLIVAVADNASKGPMFDIQERVEMVRDEVDAHPGLPADRIEVRGFTNLLIEFVRQCGAALIIRGLRAVSDFEYEFQMAAMNRQLNSDVETAFLMATESNQFISSRFVKEIARLNGDVGPFVSTRVVRHIAHRLAAEAGKP